MKVGHAWGLSYRERGTGKWQLRWRQRETQPDGSTKVVDRTALAYSVTERRHLEMEIEAALTTRGWWAAQPTAARPLDLNLEDIARLWIEWKEGTRKAAVNTRKALAGAMKRWFTALRGQLKLTAEQVVPGSAMTSTNVNAVVLAWRKAGKYADGTIYQTIAAVVDMWTWAADQEQWREVLPRPPYNTDTVMPVADAFAEPEDAATLAECDRVIQRIRLPMPRRLAVIMRYTGLRIEQASYIYREDFDLADGSLVVRKGKSRREKAQRRRVPVSPHLIDDLRDWLAAAENGPLFPDSKAADADGVALPMVGYRNLTKYITEAWETASQAGEVRREVWQPPNKKRNAPDHAFRACFQGFLQSQGVSDRVIDFLVGHAPKDTRGRHYVKPDAGAIRAAVEHLPPIIWGDGQGANVIPMRRRHPMT